MVNEDFPQTTARMAVTFVFAGILTIFGSLQIYFISQYTQYLNRPTIQKRLSLFTLVLLCSICPMPFLQGSRSIHLYFDPTYTVPRDVMALTLFELISLCMITVGVRSYSFYQEIIFAYDSLDKKSRGWTHLISDRWEGAGLEIKRGGGTAGSTIGNLRSARMFVEKTFYVGKNERDRIIRIIGPLWTIVIIPGVVEFIWTGKIDIARYLAVLCMVVSAVFVGGYLTWKTPSPKKFWDSLQMRLESGIIGRIAAVESVFLIIWMVFGIAMAYDHANDLYFYGDMVILVGIYGFACGVAYVWTIWVLNNPVLRIRETHFHRIRTRTATTATQTGGSTSPVSPASSHLSKNLSVTFPALQIVPWPSSSLKAADSSDAEMDDTIKLKEILKHIPTFLDEFAMHLLKEFSIENAMALIEMIQFQRKYANNGGDESTKVMDIEMPWDDPRMPVSWIVQNGSTMNESMCMLIDKYILSGAPWEINIDSITRRKFTRMRRDTEEWTHKTPFAKRIRVFERCILQLLQLMNDSLSRFIQDDRAVDRCRSYLASI